MTLSPYAIRLLTAAVLALNGIWLAMLAGGAVAATRDVPITWEMWMFSLTPGCAFVPALYYLLRRQRAEDPKKVRDFTGMAVVLTVMGVLVFGSTVYSLVQAYPR
ncbi:hypothetical protein AB0M36_07520 [Actinoplanes sp. NPDC051346]|uniref:hypothetical protein n=1 Tax=Actinoplanes sp. NPDC051346 TaxID=3155048 RepID=UPI00343E91B0